MPISIKDLRPEVKELLERIWRERGFRINLAQMYSLYVWAYNRAEELGAADPHTWVIETLYSIDPSLSYPELEAEIEMRGIREITPAPEVEELEYYKKRVEELERELERIRKEKPMKELEKLREEIERWKRRYEELKREIERRRERAISVEELRRVLRPIGEKIRELVDRVGELERRLAIMETAAVVPTPSLEWLVDIYTGKRFRTLSMGDLYIIRSQILPKFPAEYFYVSKETKEKVFGMLDLHVYLEDLVKKGLVPPEWVDYVLSCIRLLKEAAARGET